MKPKFSLKNDAFVIENYNQERPFSSFLPGIAGEFGKPMWVFYTNRGQCISSFGIRNKNSAMLEFYPADKAYGMTPWLGFRTFFRIRGSVYEPFKVQPDANMRQILRIRAHEIEMEETHRVLGLRTTVVIFGVPNQNAPALVRQVCVENIGRKRVDLDVLDGLPRIVPYGLNESPLKQMSRTMEAFAEVLHTSDQLPFYKLKTEPSDRPEVHWIKGGFFSFSFHAKKPLKIAIDPEDIFGEDTSFQRPLQFEAGRGVASSPQRTESLSASAFASVRWTIPPGDSHALESYYGQADSWDDAAAFRQAVEDAPDFIDLKRQENAAVIARVTDTFTIHSALPKLDAYTRQTYLDNTLRGGQPMIVGDGENSRSFHYYSRKHGDMERDYNFFELAPTYFSQGNGNFRDVNQNRRSEVMMFPGLNGGNIETFFNLLQLDGFNPLVIQFEKFLVDGELLRPGELFDRLLKTWGDREEAFRVFVQTLAHATKVQDATHGEGFWVDHWTYNLDLIENFAAVYPDRLKALMVERRDFTYYDNAHVVQPRDRKYIRRDDGAIRQSQAVIADPEKAEMIRHRKEDTHKVRTKSGTGPVYRTSLLAKMLGQIAIKTASLDPFGMGLEMEADKPGWCDALNGLPALLGSSMNETFELKRWAAFLLTHLPSLLAPGETHRVAKEIAMLMTSVRETLQLAKPNDFFRTWDALASLKERFREQTRLGVTGDETGTSREDIESFLKSVVAALDAGLKRAFTTTGIPVTYFINEVTDFEILPPPSAPVKDPDAVPVQYVRPRRFKQIPLSFFLEGPVHAFRSMTDASAAKKLYKAVKNSDLYDRKLKMYKLNVPLEKESYEIGRNKIFTPGWLENESIFLHMHYKFLLETLRSGLAEEFFEDMKTGIVAFLDPRVYGRSILENSSFIVSSRFPDKRLHGAGFVARLSGSTAEWLSIVLHMGLGPQPFQYVNGELRFEPTPTLARWLFSKKAEGEFGKDTFAFKLFGRTWVVYQNPSRRDTFSGQELHPVRYELEYQDGKTQVKEARFLPDPLASDLRDGRLLRLVITLG